MQKKILRKLKQKVIFVELGHPHTAKSQCFSSFLPTDLVCFVPLDYSRMLETVYIVSAP